MRKYVPSISENNQLKENYLAQANALIWKTEKGKINPHLNAEEVKNSFVSLKESLQKLDNSLGTGKENVLPLSLKADSALKGLSKALEGELFSRVDDAIDETCFAMDLWSETLSSGLTVTDTDEGMERKKSSWTKTRLEKRLSEVKELIADYVLNEKRIERDILALEKDRSELDSRILEEESERRINDLYRQVQILKSKLDTLNVRHSNYDACRGLLDLIYVNAKEIVAAGDYSSADLSKAKALLNVSKLREVMSEPEKSIAILRRMEAEVRTIAERTQSINKKVFDIDEHTYEVSPDALAYKEELMKKKRERESLSQIAADSLATKTEIKKTKGEN